jgi:hypothetical protein
MNLQLSALLSVIEPPNSSPMADPMLCTPKTIGDIIAWVFKETQYDRIVVVPLTRPSAPSPETALPMMSATEFGATAEMIESISKIASETIHSLYVEECVDGRKWEVTPSARSSRKSHTSRCHRSFGSRWWSGVSQWLDVATNFVITPKRVIGTNQEWYCHCQHKADGHESYGKKCEGPSLHVLSRRLLFALLNLSHIWICPSRADIVWCDARHAFPMIICVKASERWSWWNDGCKMWQCIQMCTSK